MVRAFFLKALQGVKILMVHKKNKAQALVEFVIVLPILLLILMGIIQFGLVLNAYLTITNISREGARAAAVGTSYIDVDNLIISSAPNLDSEQLNINISPSEGNRKSGETLTASITYNYKLTVPIISKLFNNEILLKAETSMRIE